MPAIASTIAGAGATRGAQHKLADMEMTSEDRERQKLALREVEADKLAESNHKADEEEQITGRCTPRAINRFLSDPGSSTEAAVASIVMQVTVILSIIQFIAETDLALHNRDDLFLMWFCLEVFFNGIFTIDYVTRLVCTGLTDGAWSGVLSWSTGFLWQAMNIIDFLAILPFYLDLGPSIMKLSGQPSPSGGILKILTIFRLFRLFRVMRVLKLMKNNKDLVILEEVAAESDVAFVLICFLIGLGVVLTGTLEYYAEQGKWDPEKRKYISTGDWLGNGRGDESMFQTIFDGWW